MAGEPGTTNCPSCDTPTPVGATLCPSCGFRLVASTDAQVLLGLLHGAAGKPAAASPIPISADALPTELISLDVAPVGRRNRAPTLLGVGLVVLIVAGTVAALSGLAGGLGSGRDAAAPVPPKVLTLRPVPPDQISASASSTLHPGSRGYRARNTLDGRDDTAWNADGDKDGSGVGVTLTWTFEQPQHVQQITVRNGYVRSSKDAQVFEHNGRIKRVRVSSDSGSDEWTMKDTPDAQSWRVDLGVTARVRFEVLEVYPGSKYQDLALTDIGFDASG